MIALLGILYLVMLFAFMISLVLSGNEHKKNYKASFWSQMLVFIIACFFFVENFEAIYSLGITVDGRKMQLLYRVIFSLLPLLAFMRLRRLRMFWKMGK